MEFNNKNQLFEYVLNENLSEGWEHTSGRVKSDGNPMVGGHWEHFSRKNNTYTKDIKVNFNNEMYIVTLEFKADLDFGTDSSADYSYDDIEIDENSIVLKDIEKADGSAVEAILKDKILELAINELIDNAEDYFDDDDWSNPFDY